MMRILGCWVLGMVFLPSLLPGQSSVPASDLWEGRHSFDLQLLPVEGGFQFEVDRKLNCPAEAFPVSLELLRNRKAVLSKTITAGDSISLDGIIGDGKYELVVHSRGKANYWMAYAGFMTVTSKGDAHIEPQKIDLQLVMRPLGPKNKEIVTDKRPTLKWESQDGAVGYSVHWSQSDPLTRKNIKYGSARVTGTEYVFEEDLVPGALCEWSVDALDASKHQFAYYSSCYFLTPPEEKAGVATIPLAEKILPQLPTDYIHLFYDCFWTVDTDIWIFPKDNYLITRKDRQTGKTEKKEGSLSGIFKSIIDLIKKNDAWSMTAKSLGEDYEKAEGGMGFMITDQTHDYLDVYTEGKMLRADFYAPDAYSKRLPEVKSLAAFLKITDAIVDAISKKEPPYSAE